MRIPWTALIFALLSGGCVFDGGGVTSTADPSPARVDVVTHDLTTDAAPPKKDAPPDGRDLAPLDMGKDQQDPDIQKPCSSGETRCGGICVDLDKDIANCGDCAKPCAGGETCTEGLCCATGLSNCNGVCTNLDKDIANCGACAKPCGPPNTCVAGTCTPPILPATGCADGSAEQTFAQGMVGCAGKVTFPKRATFCAPASRVCSAAEWVARRNSMAPTYNYWTNDALHYGGYNSNYCGVSLTAPSPCNSADSPMRVCTAHKDPLGNTCNWIGCGYKSASPNQYFGGCNGDPTAGTLCCPK